MYDVNLIDTKVNNHSVFVVEFMSICPPLSRQRVPYDVLQSLSHFQLADDYGHDRDLISAMLVDVDNLFQQIVL